MVDIKLLRVAPRNHGLGVLRVFHALQQPQVVEERHKLVGLLMAKAIAPPVLHELELRVDPLADGRRGGLRQDEARNSLQLRNGATLLVPPIMLPRPPGTRGFLDLASLGAS